METPLSLRSAESPSWFPMSTPSLGGWSPAGVSAAASTAARDRKGSTQGWEKETRDRIKVFKMGPGDSRPLGSRALFLEAASLYLVSRHAESICCAAMKSASCVPSHVSHFIDYLKLSLLFSCTRAILYKGWRS